MRLQSTMFMALVQDQSGLLSAEKLDPGERIFYLLVSMLLVVMAGLMSGLTIGLMAMDEMEMEVWRACILFVRCLRSEPRKLVRCPGLEAQRRGARTEIRCRNSSGTLHGFQAPQNASSGCVRAQNSVRAMPARPHVALKELPPCSCYRTIITSFAPLCCGTRFPWKLCRCF
jgi:hypothetical protein